MAESRFSATFSLSRFEKDLPASQMEGGRGLIDVFHRKHGRRITTGPPAGQRRGLSDGVAAQCEAAVEIDPGAGLVGGPDGEGRGP